MRCNIYIIKSTNCKVNFKHFHIVLCQFAVTPHSHPQLWETTDLLSISVVLGIFLKVAFYITNFLFSISHLRAHGNSFLLQNFPLRWFFGGGFYL